MKDLMDERFMDEQVEVLADKYFKKYREHMEILEKTPLAKIRSLRPADYWALGKQLAQWDQLEAFCESVGSVSDLGILPRIAHDVITVSYGTSPMSMIASVQPIDSELGNVYYKTVTAKTAKGNRSANETIVNPLTGMAQISSGYASAKVTEVLETSDGSTTTDSWTLANSPVRKGSVAFTFVEGGVTKTITDSYVEQSSTTGNLIGDAGVSSAVITYATGIIAVTFANMPDFGTNISVTYQVDMEAGTDDVAEIGIQLTSKPVRAIPYALKGVVGLFQKFQMMKQFGSMAEEELAIDLTNELNSEQFGAMVRLLYANIQDTTTWDSTTPSAVSAAEHRESLKFSLATVERKLVQAAGRGTRSWYVAGATVCEYFSTLAGWKTMYDGASISGAHLYGTLDGLPVIRIPVDTSSGLPGAADCVVGYKGPSIFESAAVFAPYMPITVTGMLPMANPLVNQRAAASWVGIDILVAQFLQKFSIS